MNQYWVSLVSVLLTLLGVTPVFAQSADVDYELEEVVVTAELREVNLQKVSTSIQVTSGDELRKEGKKRIDEIMQGAVGIQMQDSQNGVTFFVRGVDSGGAGGVSSVPVLVDGVAQSRGEAVRGGTLDLARAEVMRGPQSTTLGANALSGAVSLVSNKPVFNYEASTSLDVGKYHNATMEGVMNVPLSDNQAIRIAFSNQKRDSYFSNGAGNSDLTNARIKYRWQPSDDLDITATVSHQNIGGNGVSQLTLLTYGRYVPWIPGSAYVNGSTLNQLSQCVQSSALLADPNAPASQAYCDHAIYPNSVVQPWNSITFLGDVPVYPTASSTSYNLQTGWQSGSGKIINTPGGAPDVLGHRQYWAMDDGTNFRTRDNAWDDGTQYNAWINQPFRNSNIEQASVEFNWNTDLGQITFLPSYQHTHYTALEPFRGYQAMGANNYQRTKILDFRINSNSGDRLEWQVGLYHSDDKQNNITSFVNLPGVGMGSGPGYCNIGAYDAAGNVITAASNGTSPTATVYPLLNTEQCYYWTLTPKLNRTNSAAYFNTEYALRDTVRLIAGARYNKQTAAQTIYENINGNQYGPYQTCPPDVSYLVCNGPKYLNPTYGVATFPALDNLQVAAAGGNLNSMWSHTTYRAGAEWDFAPETMIYGVYSTGFNPGAFDSMQNLTYPSVTLEQVTAGFKSQLLDNRLQFNSEAFLTTYHNRAIDGSVISYTPIADANTCTVGMGQTAVAADNSAFGFCFAAGTPLVDKFVSKGIDMDLTWLLTPNDRIGLTAEFMKATYDQAPQAKVALTNTAGALIPSIYLNGSINPEYVQYVFQQTAGGMNASDLTTITNNWNADVDGYVSETVATLNGSPNTSGYVVGASAKYLANAATNALQGFVGTTLQNSPQFSATWNYSHNFLLSKGDRLTPRIAGVYKTRYWSLGGGGPGNTGVNVIAQAAKDPSSPYYLAWQQEYVTWDASVAWDKADGKFTLTGYVKNLTNEVVMAGYTYQYVSLSPPRTWGATFVANF